MTLGGVRGTRSVTMESTRGEANAEERAETTSVVWARRAQTGGGEGGGGQKDGGNKNGVSGQRRTRRTREGGHKVGRVVGAVKKGRWSASAGRETFQPSSCRNATPRFDYEQARPLCDALPVGSSYISYAVVPSAALGRLRLFGRQAALTLRLCHSWSGADIQMA